MNRRCFVCLLVAVAVGSAAGGPDEKLGSFSGFADDVNKVGKSQLEGATAEQKRKYQELVATVRKDLSELTEITRGEAPEPYRKNLRLHQEALQELVLDTNRPVKERLSTLEAVSIDLQAKKDFARNNPSGATDRVEVSAETPNKMSRRPGLQVWYVPKAWQDDESRYERFDGVSSPAVGSLVPGGYLMWTYDADNKKAGMKQPISIGASGQRKQSIDLPVP